MIVNQNWRVTILTRAWIIPEEGDQRPLLFVLWLLVQWKPISPGFVIIIWLVMILCQPHLVWYKRADGCMLLISDMSVGAAQFCDFQSEQIWRGKSVFLSCKSCSTKAGFSYQQLVLSRSQWVKSDIVCTTPSQTGAWHQAWGTWSERLEKYWNSIQRGVCSCRRYCGYRIAHLEIAGGEQLTNWR